MDKVEHDFSAIEQALAQNEAPMRMRERIGKGGLAGIVILATGVAVTLAALGIGKGIFWAKEEKLVEVEVPVEKIVEKIVEVPAPQLPKAPDLETGSKIVRNYVIFQSVDVANRNFTDLRLEVGHQYSSSAQATYDHAWCHARGDFDGLDVTVGLSRKSPDGVITPEVDVFMVQRMNLSKAAIAEWQSLCPYL